MAGFLGMGNYSRPGPGVSKNERQKHSFFLFFELYFRKFWQLCELNILYFVSCILFTIPMILAGQYAKDNSFIYYICFVPLIGISIPTSGFAFILRNYARQEHAFLWLDYKDTIKSNWKQSLAVGTISFIAFFVMIFSAKFYYFQMNNNNNDFFVIPFLFSAIFIILFTVMQFYIYTLLITFQLSVKQILKNAFIFSFAGLWHNLIIILFCGILALATYILSPLSFFFVPFILLSTFGFIISFNTWPVIDKYMMPKHEDDDDNEEKIFEDTGGKQ
jgi:uncharacterized membrane protein YesL